MRALVLAASAAMSATASTPTAYIDIHQVTSFADTGAIKSGFLFRVEASESGFARASPPKGPKWTTNSALTGGAGKEEDHVNSVTRKQSGGGGGRHTSHRLMMSPPSDPYLCNEADGVSDYKNPAGNAAAGVFDPDTLLSGFEDGYILVPRGQCTFEAKSRSAQRLGAAGVVVRNTLDSRYRLKNETLGTSNSVGTMPDWSNTMWPSDKHDYECGNNKAAEGMGWRAEVETSALDFDPSPYGGDGSTNDAVLTGPASDGNLCAKQPSLDGPFDKVCPSQRCLLTGRNASNDGSMLEACCAWDTYVRMGTDGEYDGDAVPQEEEEDIVIPALFVTMESGDELYDLLVDADANSQNGGDTVQFVNVVPYRRWYPSAHYTSVVLCLLAVLTLWISARESSGEYRTSWKKISKAVSEGVLVLQRSATNSAAPGRERAETEDTVDVNDDNMELEMAPEVEMTGRDAGGADAQNAEAAPSNPFAISEDANEDDFVGNPPAGLDTANGDSGEEQQQQAATAPDAAPAPPAQPQPQRVNLQSGSATAAAQNMEINAYHAVFFVVFASLFLSLLFFFNLYKFVRVVYGIGGSGAMTQIILRPLLDRLASKYLGKLKSVAFGNLPGCRGERFTWVDVLSYATGASLGIAWIVVGLTRVQPMASTYYWIIQDVMGVSFCVLILGLIHINSIMVASILLFLVFVYDAFYVLISPYFFGTSVMVDVATGGASGVDANYCAKYPSDKYCWGSLAPLPMLLAIPWFNDYRGGFSMLGLGDIILPGLLISFAARYDSARELVRKCSQTSSMSSGGNAVRAEEEIVNEFGGGSSTRYHYQLGRVRRALFRGYFGPLMIAYGIGLIIAYVVVWLTQRGQPALLYLVPTCLGTTFFLGWLNRELSELWTGPKVMRKANRMVNLAGRIPEARTAAGREASTDLPESSTFV